MSAGNCNLNNDEIDFNLERCFRGTPHSPILGQWKDEFYSLEYENRGECHIFSHEKFYLSMEDLMETKLETELLHHTFQNLKFDVYVHKDKRLSEIIDIMFEVNHKDHTKSMCLVFCFLSYGDQKGLYAANKSYDIEKVLTPFSKSLPGKPKMFIFQAKNPRFDEDASRESTDSGVLDYFRRNKYYTKRIPSCSDFLIASSTFSGTYTLPNGKKISNFVRLLCHVLWKYNKTLDLLSMLTLVNYEMVDLYEDPDSEEGFFFKSTLTRIFNLA